MVNRGLDAALVFRIELLLFRAAGEIMKNSYICGLDFGTSNSALSLFSCNKARLVHIEDNKATIPSAIFFPYDGGRTLYGREAVDAYMFREDGRFMRSPKRALGTSLMAEGTFVGSKKIKFEQIISDFVIHMKNRAEQEIGNEINHVSAGRPVRFTEGDAEENRKAESQLQGILEKAGFREIVFQYEPIAAAFSHEAGLDSREYLSLVVDVGGGTSDFTVIRLSGEYVDKMDRREDILSNDGLRIGGNDFDRMLAIRTVMPHLGMGTRLRNSPLDFPNSPFFDLAEWSRVNSMYAPKYKRELFSTCAQGEAVGKLGRLMHIVEEELGHILLNEVETGKVALSDNDKAYLDLSFVEEGLGIGLSRPEFEAAIEALVLRLRAKVQAVIMDAGVKPEQIDLVILTGGGSGVPLVQEIVTSALPYARLSRENMLSSVGIGLAYDAKRRFL